MAIPVLFLSQGSPWPPQNGGALRTWGLLQQIGARCDVHLVIAARQPLSQEQRAHLQPHIRLLAEVPMRDGDWRGRLAALGDMGRRFVPYHPAALHRAVARCPEIAARIYNWPGIVFTNNGQWGVFTATRSGVPQEDAPNWILNQCDAEIYFWHAYAAQANNWLVRAAAQVNYRFANRFFPHVYRRVGRIISVSDEDRALTLPYAGLTPVEVIPNGIDAAAYQPNRALRAEGDGAQFLFTGTSARRNVTALRDFVDGILPQVRKHHPESRLLVAGNFSPEAQADFPGYAGLNFTGRVDDMAPFFDAADIFVAPFRDTHGSKLKVAEAMAMALPIVASEAGVRGFPLRHGESVLVAQNNEEFARHLVYLIEHPEERARLGCNARAIALNALDWNMLGSRVIEIIEEQWQMLPVSAQTRAIQQAALMVQSDSRNLPKISSAEDAG